MWTYSQSTGKLMNPDGVTVGVGYAGAGAGRNNPLMQDIPNEGPLPRAVYVRASEPFTHPHAGPFTIRLGLASGQPQSLLCGRSSFMLHGDNKTHTASEGCIIMPRIVREMFANSPDNLLQVVE